MWETVYLVYNFWNTEECISNPKKSSAINQSYFSVTKVINSMGFEDRQTCVQVPAFTCVILSMLFSHFKPWFMSLQNGENSELLWRLVYSVYWGTRQECVLGNSYCMT